MHWRKDVLHLARFLPSIGSAWLGLEGISTTGSASRAVLVHERVRSVGALRKNVQQEKSKTDLRAFATSKPVPGVQKEFSRLTRTGNNPPIDRARSDRVPCLVKLNLRILLHFLSPPANSPIGTFMGGYKPGGKNTYAKQRLHRFGPPGSSGWLRRDVTFKISAEGPHGSSRDGF